MRVLLVPVALVVAVPPVAAQEADEVLARQLGEVVRDPRQTLAARVAAARSLGKMGPRAAPAIGDLVAVINRLRGNEQQPLQEAMIETLGLIGSPARPSVPYMVRTAGRDVDTDLAIRRATDQILAAPDEQDVSALIAQLSSRDPSLRLRSAKALGTLGTAARTAVPSLVVALGDADGDVRRAAVTALRLIEPAGRPPEIVIRAIALDLRDLDATVRLLALRNLARIGAPAAVVAAQIDALRGDPDPDVRRAAAAALAQLTAAP